MRDIERTWEDGMRIVIWGLGTRGKRIFSRLIPGEVVAFIDNDPEKIGTHYEGVAVIDLKQYIESYSEYFILISMLRPDEAIRQLKGKNIYNYFDALDCPVELWGPGEYVDLNAYLRHLNQGKRYGILGTNFYSIFCFDRMMKKGTNNIFLIPGIEDDKRKRELIKKAFDFVEFMPADVCIHDLDQIFVATGSMNNLQMLKKKVGLDVALEDIFDLSGKIPEYRNPEMAQFKNIHLGDRCFIVATGPSLTMEDLDILYQNREYSIGMNRVFLAFEQTQWRPSYYLVSDWRCIREDEDIIRTMSVPYKFVSDQYADFWKKKATEGIYRFHNNGVYVSGELPPFSEDLVYGLYGKATVTYECIQLAAYMGFKEIYLLGVDYDFSSNYKDESNHFIPTYYSEDSKTGFFLKKESMEAYEAAKKYAESHGIKIYNATRGGKLELFERRNFDELFAMK